MLSMEKSVLHSIRAVQILAVKIIIGRDGKFNDYYIVVYLLLKLICMYVNGSINYLAHNYCISVVVAVSLCVCRLLCCALLCTYTRN